MDMHYGKRIGLRTAMDKIYAKTGCQFVIVIDEWDAVFRSRKNGKKGRQNI